MSVQENGSREEPRDLIELLHFSNSSILSEISYPIIKVVENLFLIHFNGFALYQDCMPSVISSILLFKSYICILQIFYSILRPD